MKVIRITKCDDCPCYRSHGIPGVPPFCFCMDETGTSRYAIITDPFVIKENCPLEDGE